MPEKDNVFQLLCSKFALLFHCQLSHETFWGEETLNCTFKINQSQLALTISDFVGENSCKSKDQSWSMTFGTSRVTQFSLAQFRLLVSRKSQFNGTRLPKRLKSLCQLE